MGTLNAKAANSAITKHRKQQTEKFDERCLKKMCCADKNVKYLSRSTMFERKSDVKKEFLETFNG